MEKGGGEDILTVQSLEMVRYLRDGRGDDGVVLIFRQSGLAGHNLQFQEAVEERTFQDRGFNFQTFRERDLQACNPNRKNISSRYIPTPSETPTNTTPL